MKYSPKHLRRYMSNRYEKRKLKKEAGSIIRKAKIDMAEYLESLNRVPEEVEVKAWQAGYIAGLNRANGNKE